MRIEWHAVTIPCDPAATTAPSVAVATPTVTAAPTPTTEAIPTRSPLPTIGIPADDGARIVGATTVDARTRDLEIDSPAVGDDFVRLLIPTQFDAKPSTRWPVLYLLVGARGDYTIWSTETDVATLTSPTNLLVVMPGITPGAYYSDFWNGGQGGPPKWETFDLVELPQILERNWHASTTCAITGASMGGFGAMSYAARHPVMFRAAASYSGYLDPLHWPDNVDPIVWGDPVAQAAVWKAHDPTTIAAALTGTRLFVSYGNGVGSPSSLDPDGSIEAEFAHESRTFVQRLAALKVPVTVDAYVGTHAYSYFGRELGRSLPAILKALGE